VPSLCFVFTFRVLQDADIVDWSPFGVNYFAVGDVLAVFLWWGDDYLVKTILRKYWFLVFLCYFNECRLLKAGIISNYFKPCLCHIFFSYFSLYTSLKHLSAVAEMRFLLMTKHLLNQQQSSLVRFLKN
jgi:hypothetical protein